MKLVPKKIKIPIPNKFEHYNKRKMNKLSIHPYSPYIPEGAEKLIIGTMPPYRFCHKDTEKLFTADVDFYYGSKDNDFWRLLSGILGTELHFLGTEQAINEGKELLRIVNAGVADIINSCYHNEGKSSDTSLNVISLFDISELLFLNPNIKELIYTSSNVITQMNKAINGCHNWLSKNRMDGEIVINSRKYPVHLLYSPSPNALRRVSKESRISRYMELFNSYI